MGREFGLPGSSIGNRASLKLKSVDMIPSRFLSRRCFLGVAATGVFLPAADRLFGQPSDKSGKPSPELERLGAVALAEAKKAGATYADIRINRYRQMFSDDPPTTE